MSNEKIKNCGFHHIAIKVADYDKTYALYTDFLGFKPVLTWGADETRACMLDIGDGGCVELFAGGAPMDNPEGKWMHFALRVDDADAAYELALTGGAAPRTPPMSTTIKDPANPTDIRIAFVTGFDGEIIEFFSYC